MTRLPTFLVAATLMLGCRDAAEPAPAWPPDIAGTWTWARSTGPSGENITPASEGRTARLVLTASGAGSSHGTYVYLEDGETAANGSYGLGWEDAPGNDFVVWEPAFGRYHHQTWVTVSAGDTLVLSDARTGGYASRWSRRDE